MSLHVEDLTRAVVEQFHNLPINERLLHQCVSIAIHRALVRERVECATLVHLVDKHLSDEEQREWIATRILARE